MKTALTSEQASRRFYECGVSLDRILWIAGQSHEQNNDDWEDLLYDGEQLQKILGIELHEDYLESDDYNELVSELLRLWKCGFLVKLRKPMPRNIKLDDDGKVKSWSEGGSWRTEWCYVDSLDECVPLAEQFADRVLEEAVRRQKKAKT